MSTLRHFFRARPELAALLLVLALCLKAVVPAGYMPTTQGSALTVELCSGATPGAKVTIALPTKGSHGPHNSGDNAGKTMDHPCAFSSHSAAAIDTVLPALLAAALAFVFVAAILRAPLALPAIRAQLRPPLRGPPAQA